MKNGKCLKSTCILNTIGILFVFTCAALTIVHPHSKPVNDLNIVLLVIQALIGLAVIIIARKVTKKFFHLFMGLLYLSWSILSLLIELILPYEVQQLWPVFGIISGIILFITGKVKYGKLKFGFVIPSITLLGMGIWYSLFSLGIIKISFRSVVATLGPFFMISIAVFLVVFFLLQQRHTELVFSDEETGVFSDEESSFVSEIEEDD